MLDDTAMARSVSDIRVPFARKGGRAYERNGR